MIEKYKHLQKAALPGESPVQWTEENLHDGFEYFHELHEHYPSVPEVDDFEYLPSPRTLDRRFGGIRALRKVLNLSHSVNDYNSGKARGKTAQMADNRARIFEEEIFNYLVSIFPEIRVHEQKVIRPAGVQSDFFIYTSSTKGVVIDIFYAKSLPILGKIINIKHPKYQSVQFPTLLVLVGNEEINQSDIDRMIANRKNPIKNHIKVFIETEFKKQILNIAYWQGE